jgi:hypothetical protein
MKDQTFPANSNLPAVPHCREIFSAKKKLSTNQSKPLDHESH